MLCNEEMAANIKAHIRAARSLRTPKRKDDLLQCTPEMSRPFIDETRFYTSLHFRAQEAQSRMLKQEPDRLVLDYTRTMMAFLLFNSRPDSIAIIGLGGGSLAKFCFRELPDARIDVVEINPHVVALRDAFLVPPDGDRFHVHLDDGARFIGQSPERYNVLLVDAYTRDGIPAQLSSVEFYESCKRALRENGVMVLNLYCKDADLHIDRIRQCFDNSFFVVDEKDGTNRVIIARRGSLLPLASLAQQRPTHVRPSAWSSLQPAFLRAKSALKKMQLGALA